VTDGLARERYGRKGVHLRVLTSFTGLRVCLRVLTTMKGPAALSTLEIVPGTALRLNIEAQVIL